MINILQQQESGVNSSSSVTRLVRGSSHRPWSIVRVSRTQAITLLQSLYNAKIFSDIKDDPHRMSINDDPRQFLDNNKIFRSVLRSAPSSLFNHFLSILGFYLRPRRIFFPQRPWPYRWMTRNHWAQRRPMKRRHRFHHQPCSNWCMPLLDINENRIRSVYSNPNEDARSIVVHSRNYSRCLLQKMILFFVSVCVYLLLVSMQE